MSRPIAPAQTSYSGALTCRSTASSRGAPLRLDGCADGALAVLDPTRRAQAAPVSLPAATCAARIPAAGKR